MTRSDPLVSVIIPSYNSNRTLELCLQSVAGQTYSPIEVIVVDDGSTDGALETARASGATVISTGTNSGQSVARNIGAEHANGEILFFLDSDVALDAHGVEIAVRALRDNPRIGAMCGAYDPEPLLPTTRAAHYRTVEQYVWFNEVEGPIPGLYSALFGIRAEVFREIGPFDPALRHTEDQDYGFRLLRRYEMWVTPAIHGRHDHDATLRTIFRKVFQRTRLGMQLWLRYRSLPGGAATGARAWSSATVLAAVLSLPLLWPLGPVGALVPLAFVILTIGLDRSMFRHAFASRGLGFGLYFTVVRLLVLLTTAVAGGIGVLQYLLTHRAAERRALATAGTSGGRPTARRS